MYINYAVPNIGEMKLLFVVGAFQVIHNASLQRSIEAILVECETHISRSFGWSHFVPRQCQVHFVHVQVMGFVRFGDIRAHRQL